MTNKMFETTKRSAQHYTDDQKGFVFYYDGKQKFVHYTKAEAFRSKLIKAGYKHVSPWSSWC